MRQSASSTARCSPAVHAAAVRAQRRVLRLCLDCGEERDSEWNRCRVCRFLLVWRVQQCVRRRVAQARRDEQASKRQYRQAEA